MTSLRLTKQLSDLAEPLDEVADPLQDAVNALPKPVRDVVDGVWLGNPPHPALTDIPLGAWTAAFALDLVGSEAADDALAGHRGLGRVLSGVAYAGAAFSAHLGGHLSFGLGVRVNRTAFESPRDRYAPVCEESELNGGKLVGVELEGESVVIARSEESGEVCAIAASAPTSAARSTKGSGTATP